MSDYEGVGYLRRSKIRKGRERETISIEKQRDAVNAKAAEIGATKFTIYEDAGGHRSGRTTHNRPDWVRLKEALKHPECRFLVVFMIDRSARSVREIGELVDTCKESNKRFVTCWDGIDTDRTGFTASAILDINSRAMVAQYQSDNTSDLMKQTSAYFRDKLMLPWGMCPFGMKRGGKGQDAYYVPHDKHGNTVRSILTWYSAGLSYDAVAIKANDQQMRHEGRDHLPKRFSREVIRSIVGNVLFYAGYAIVGQRFRSKNARIILHGEGTYLQRYATAMHAQRGPAIEPLIDEMQACAVIERRFKNQLVGRKATEWVALLTPIAYWGDVRLRADVSHGLHYYRSRRSGPYIDGDRADTEIIQHMAGIQFPPEMRDMIRRSVAERVGDERKLKARRDIDTFSRQMEVLMDLLLSGQVQREHYNTRYAELERALRVAQSELVREDDVDKLMNNLNDLSSAIKQMRDINKKKALSKLFEKIEFSDMGEISRFHLRPWAQQAWGEIVFAYRLYARTEAIFQANSAPGERRLQSWPEDVEWLIERTA